MARMTPEQREAFLAREAAVLREVRDTPEEAVSDALQSDRWNKKTQEALGIDDFPEQENDD